MGSAGASWVALYGTERRRGRIHAVLACKVTCHVMNLTKSNICTYFHRTNAQ
jgi:hypothetical protein